MPLAHCNDDANTPPSGTSTLLYSTPLSWIYYLAYCTILYYTLLYSTLLYSTILCYAILCYAILYYIILCYIILYYIILYYTLLYYYCTRLDYTLGSASSVLQPRQVQLQCLSLQTAPSPGEGEALRAQIKARHQLGCTPKGLVMLCICMYMYILSHSLCIYVYIYTR